MEVCFPLLDARIPSDELFFSALPRHGIESRWGDLSKICNRILRSVLCGFPGTSYYSSCVWVLRGKLVMFHVIDPFWIFHLIFLLLDASWAVVGTLFTILRTSWICFCLLFSCSDRHNWSNSNEIKQGTWVWLADHDLDMKGEEQIQGVVYSLSLKDRSGW